MTTRFLSVALAISTVVSPGHLSAQELNRVEVMRQAIPALGYFASGRWKFEMQSALETARAGLAGLPALGRAAGGESFRYYPQDPADSLYRQARTEFSRGNFEAAMGIFDRYIETIRVRDTRLRRCTTRRSRCTARAVRRICGRR